MREIPILFKGEMVNAIREGRKSVTRRIVPFPEFVEFDGYAPNGDVLCSRGDQSTGSVLIKNRYGAAGDRLWVKETWRPSFNPGRGLVVRYNADASDRVFGVGGVPHTWTMPKVAARGNVTPLYMPRWASRLTLEVTDVRVERLQDITEEDARAEGCDGDCPVGYIPAHSKSPCLYHFRHVWDAINGEDSWPANPWVWRVAFRRLA